MDAGQNTFEGMLKGLTATQLEYVGKRILSSSQAEAAKEAGVISGTVSRWKQDGVPIDEIVELAKQDGVIVAKEKLRRLSGKAVDVLEEEMDKKRGGKRIEAALAVLDRVGIVKGESFDVTSGGERLGSGASEEQRLAAVVALLDRARERVAGQDNVG